MAAAGLPPCPWAFPGPADLPHDDLVAHGADLQPATLITAYAAGLFPMPQRRHLAWFSPDPRAVLPLAQLRVTRSLRRSLRRYEVSVDADFPSVIEHCADPRRSHGWIDRAIVEAYCRLHELGVAHSVETWDGDELVGGLYGVSLGALFAGESMFSRADDASKVALCHLVELLRPVDALLDVQWNTEHLASLGVTEIPRTQYLSELAEALSHPGPDWGVPTRRVL